MYFFWWNFVGKYPNKTSMNYLSAENLGKTFGDRWLFKELNFGISKGDKVALVGANGTGKTTLMSILAGTLPADEGLVSLRKGISVGYLPQNPVFNESLKVIDTLFVGDNPTLTAIKNYELALALDHSELEAAEALSNAMADMDTYQAWDYESRVKQILGRLGIHNFEQSVAQLSGGQRKRVALAKLLIEDPEFVILDEPTNHLDLETIEWLENYLSTANGTMLLVSHDRYFLDKVCNNIVELDNGKIFGYKGNYQYFLEKKAEREAIENAEIDKARNLMRKELDWMRRQPKARGTKAKYRVDAFYDLKDKASQGRNDAALQINVQMARQGSKILEFEKLNKSFGDQVILKDFTYTFRRKDRIGIIGKNGVGKSSFLNILTNEIAPDSGRIEVGETIVFGYYTQGDLEYREDQRVIDVIKEIAEVIKTGSGDVISASQLLNLFLFEPKKQYTLVSKLSGGEKRRLHLLKVLIKSPNFLILDEPTNDLDIQTLNVLEDFLEAFGGVLVLVSHDRYFMDRLVEHLFIFEGEGMVRDFPGNYTDFREEGNSIADEDTQKAQGLKNQEVKDKPKAEAAKRKLSFKEQKELETLEREIEELGKKKAQLTEKLNAGGSYDDLNDWAKTLEQISESLDEKEMRWLELSE
jgi:ABC transport system ATP-binding/permease protein